MGWRPGRRRLGIGPQGRRRCGLPGRARGGRQDVSGSGAGISLIQGGLSGFYRLDPDESSAEFSWVLFAALSHRYWRLRESAGFFSCDTSADGLTWDTLGSISNPFSMNNVRVAIMAGCWNSTPDPGVAELDNYNILP